MVFSSLLVKDGRGMASQRQRQAQRRIPLIESREPGPGLALDQLKGRERLVPAPDELLIYQERVKPAPHEPYSVAARRGVIKALTEPRESVWLHAPYGLASFLADHHGGRLFVPGDAVLSARRSTMRLWRDRDQTIAPRTRTSRRLTQTDVEGYISKAPSPPRRASAPPSAPTPTTKIASNPFALLAHDTVTHLAAASRPSPPRAQPAEELNREVLRQQERDAAKALARQRKEAARLAAKKDRDDLALIDQVMRKDAAAAEAKEKRAEAARIKAAKTARLVKEAEEKAAKSQAAKSQAARSQAARSQAIGPEEERKQVQGAAKQDAVEVQQKAVEQETGALALKRARVTAAVAAAKAALAQAPVVEAIKVLLPPASSSTAVPIDEVLAGEGVSLVAGQQAPACAAAGGGGLKASAPVFVPKTPAPPVQADVLDDSTSSSVVSTGPFHFKASNIYMNLPRLSDATASTLSDMDSSTSSSAAVRPSSHSHALSSLSCDLSASGAMEEEPKAEEQPPLCPQALMVDGAGTCDGEEGQAQADRGTSLAPSAEGAGIEREDLEVVVAAEEEARQAAKPDIGAPCDEQEGNSLSGRASARAPPVEGDELDDSNSSSDVSTGPFQRKGGNMYLSLPRFSDATDSGLDISSATSVGEGCVSRTTSRSHASSVSMDVSASGALEEAEPKGEEGQQLCSQALVVDGEDTEEEELHGEEGQAAVSKDEEPVLEMRATRAPSAATADAEMEVQEIIVAAEEQARRVVEPGTGAPCDEQEGNSPSNDACAEDMLDNACLTDTNTHHHSSSTGVEPEEGEASAKASNTRGFKALVSSVQDSEHREDELALSTSSPAAVSTTPESVLVGGVLKAIEATYLPAGTLLGSLPGMADKAQDPDALLRLPHGCSVNIDFSQTIGKGMFGSVHRATYRSAQGEETTVAAKVLPLPTTDCLVTGFRALDAQAAVLAEIVMHTVAQQVMGGKVVQLHGATVLPPCPIQCPHGYRVVMIMEYCNHGSLADLIQKLPQLLQEGEQTAVWLRVVRVVMQLVEGLRSLHDAGLTHNDLKPENVVLTGEGGDELRVCDMGLTWFKGAEAYALFDFGTTAYIAPEMPMADDRREECPKLAELYSLGLILASLCTGCVVSNEMGGFLARDGSTGFALPSLVSLFEHALPGCPDVLANIVEQLVREQGPDERLGLEDMMEQLTPLAQTMEDGMEYELQHWRRVKGECTCSQCLPPAVCPELAAQEEEEPAQEEEDGEELGLSERPQQEEQEELEPPVLAVVADTSVDATVSNEQADPQVQVEDTGNAEDEPLSVLAGMSSEAKDKILLQLLERMQVLESANLDERVQHLEAKQLEAAHKELARERAEKEVLQAKNADLEAQNATLRQQLEELQLKTHGVATEGVSQKC